MHVHACLWLHVYWCASLYTAQASRYMHAYNVQHTHMLAHQYTATSKQVHACVQHATHTDWHTGTQPQASMCMHAYNMQHTQTGTLVHSHKQAVHACVQHATHTCWHTSTQPQASMYMHAYNMQHTQTGTLVHSHKQAGTCMRTTCNTHMLAH